MDSSHRRKGAAKQFTNDHQPDGQDGTVREAAVLSTCNSAHGPWVHRAGKTMPKLRLVAKVLNGPSTSITQA
ncbi:Lysine--tRNA ligase [Fusarium oxysporum f. sp. albedinis]|nr:Lysine--tRNA ligase [Fusarium oxysporum f. sp. albedinis]